MVLSRDAGGKGGRAIAPSGPPNNNALGTNAYDGSDVFRICNAPDGYNNSIRGIAHRPTNISGYIKRQNDMIDCQTRLLIQRTIDAAIRSKQLPSSLIPDLQQQCWVAVLSQIHNYRPTHSLLADFVRGIVSRTIRQVCKADACYHARFVTGKNLNRAVFDP